MQAFGGAISARVRSWKTTYSVRSKPTSLVNLQGGYQLSKHLRATADVFNLFDAEHSDMGPTSRHACRVNRWKASRDIHLHPAIPPTVQMQDDS